LVLQFSSNSFAHFLDEICKFKTRVEDLLLNVLKIVRRTIRAPRKLFYNSTVIVPLTPPGAM